MSEDKSNDPFDIENFKGWLSGQDAQISYTYMDMHNCPICRYLRHVGIGAKWASDGGIQLLHGFRIPLPDAFKPATIEGNYGELLARL